MSDQPLAVIDIGSNSGRIVVVEMSNGHLSTIADGRVPLRLATELKRGRLGGSAIERTVAAVRDFAAIASAVGASATVAVATSAVRESANADDLVARVRRETGVDVQIVSGADEARLSFVGAVNGLAVNSGMLLDVGGGSVEVTTFRDRALKATWTLPLGALRMSQGFFEHDPPTTGEVRAMVDAVHAKLMEAQIPALAGGDVLIGTGGSVRALAKIDRRERTWPIPKIHGYELSAGRVAGLAELLRDRSTAKRARMRGVNHDRADSIAAGALVTATVMRQVEASAIVVAGQGLREGIAYERLGARIGSVQQTREAAVAAFAARFSTWRPDAASRRAVVAAHLGAALLPDAGEDVAEMLRHAAVLLDIGRAVHHYNVEQHAAALILSADLTGFTHEHLALIASMLMSGDGGAKVFRRILPGPLSQAAAAAGVVLEIAIQIERRLPQGHAGGVEADGSRRSILVRAPVPGAVWRDAMSERTRAVFGRPFEIETEDLS